MRLDNARMDHICILDTKKCREAIGRCNPCGTAGTQQRDGEREGERARETRIKKQSHGTRKRRDKRHKETINDGLRAGSFGVRSFGVGVGCAGAWWRQGRMRAVSPTTMASKQMLQCKSLVLSFCVTSYHGSTSMTLCSAPLAPLRPPPPPAAPEVW